MSSFFLFEKNRYTGGILNRKMEQLQISALTHQSINLLLDLHMNMYLVTKSNMRYIT